MQQVFEESIIIAGGEGGAVDVVLKTIVYIFDTFILCQDMVYMECYEFCVWLVYYIICWTIASGVSCAWNIVSDEV